MMMLRCSTAILLSLLAAAGGCADSGPRACVTGADCASGICLSDGTCAPEGGDGGGADAGEGSDGPVAACTPDHDGTVTRAEVPLAAGRTATFRIALDAPVDTAGQLLTGGERHWSFAAAVTGDQDVTVELQPVDGAWWADAFPGATYAARLSQSQDLLGVFEVTDAALLLRGVVSPSAGLYRTELAYDPAVRVLDFPIDPDDTWTDTATVSGLASGVTALYTEEYASDVDAVGDVDTPYGNFPVLRIGVDLTRTIGAGIVTSRTYLFVSECYGAVATVVSQDYEPDDEFTDAAELRRLAP